MRPVGVEERAAFRRHLGAGLAPVQDFEDYLVARPRSSPALSRPRELPLTVAIDCDQYLHRRLMLLEAQLVTVSRMALATHAMGANTVSVFTPSYPKPWPCAVWHKTLPLMAEWVGAPMAMLFTPTVLPEDGGFYFNYGIPEAAMELWRVRYQSSDIWTMTAVQQNRLQEGSIFTGNDVVPTEELLRTIWYQEFLSTIGIGQLLTNIVYGLDSLMHHPTALSYFRDSNG